MLYRYHEKHCLNGFWDILPLGDPAVDAAAPPREGWISGVYTVPSFYNQTPVGVRRPGGRAFRADPEGLYLPGAENLYDTTGYPVEWSRAKSVWLRRFLQVQRRPHRRYFIVFESLGPRGWVYLNGRQLAFHDDTCLPCVVDVTDALTGGDDELAVRLDDYERRADGKSLYPAGNVIPATMRGLWQDVWLVEKGDVYVEDVTIVTSVRRRTLSARYELVNTTDAALTVTLCATVKDAADGSEALRPAPLTVALPARGRAQAAFETGWEHPKLWDASHPDLYFLHTELAVDGALRDESDERFGFREVWIEGDSLLLNGFALHLFSDFGHKATAFHHTVGWVDKWFHMLADYNMNATRLHTHPHPEFITDMADERGVYVTSENSLIFGDIAADDPRFWDNAERHALRHIRREKNHPSILLYSCENEMRWGGCDTELTRNRLTALRGLYNRLDPTRVAYHEGDSSLWDEHTQPLISRHYTRDAAGLGWWDHSRPLHAGECALYHYAGPNNAVGLVGDRGWGDHQNVIDAVFRDFLYIAEDARANGVCCLGPWNLSALTNLRVHGEKEFHYDDYTTPGVKPKLAHAGASEFAYWEDGRGYLPQPGSELQAAAFRPFAVIDSSRRGQFYALDPTVKTFTVVNDTPGAVDCGVFLRIGAPGKTPVLALQKELSIGRGERRTLSFALTMPDAGEYEYRFGAVCGGKTLDERKRTITVRRAAQVTLSGELAVLGEGFMKPLLEALGLSYRYVNSLAELSGEKRLLVEKDAVTPGSRLNRELVAFAEYGGRVVVARQRFSPAPAVKMRDKSVFAAFVRSFGHPLLDGLTEGDFAFWGDDAYSLSSGASYVADRLYEKDDGGKMTVVLDADEGEFGTGGLRYTPLFTAEYGSGVVVCCQLNLCDRWEKIPAARQVFVNLLRYIDTYEPAAVRQPAVVETDADPTAAIEFARSGGDALVFLSPKNAAAASRALGVNLQLTADDELYHAVRTGDHALLGGISNEDLCGVERFLYAPPEAVNATVADYFMEDDAAIEPLAATCPRSGLAAFHVYDGAAELMRAYTTLHAVIENDAPARTLIGLVHCGAGRVVLSTFRPPREAVRFARVRNRLVRNLGGVTAGKDLFAGDCVERGARSDGYPGTVQIYRGRPDAALLEKMCSLCAYNTERMNTTPILNGADFTPTAGEGGVWSSPDGAPCAIYFPLLSPTQRKNVGSNLGVPDPGAQTFLDVKTAGRTRLFLNGAARNAPGVPDFAAGDATYPELALERGLNHVLLLWEPAGAGDRLGLLWRNIKREPEYGFLFDGIKENS